MRSRIRDHRTRAAWFWKERYADVPCDAKDLGARQRPADPVGGAEAMAHGIGFAGEGDLVALARDFAAPIDRGFDGDFWRVGSQAPTLTTGSFEKRGLMF